MPRDKEQFEIPNNNLTGINLQKTSIENSSFISNTSLIMPKSNKINEKTTDT